MTTQGEVELFRRVMAADGPMLVRDPDRFRRAVAALSGRFDGKLTDPTIRVMANGEDKFVWFASEEADLIWGSWNSDESIDDVVSDMPYPREDESVAALANAALTWPEGEWL